MSVEQEPLDIGNMRMDHRDSCIRDEIIYSHVANRIGRVDRDTRVEHTPYVFMIVRVVHLKNGDHDPLASKCIREVNREYFSTAERKAQNAD
ncbi:hypothetical protein D3C80_1854880 [compost metagenome]